MTMRAGLTSNEVHGVRVKGRVDLGAVESIFEAEGIDDLVAGPPMEAGARYALLLECARGEDGECFDAICRVAEKRRVTPAYLIDRADVLVESAEARQAGDLYRVLGVPPLASQEEIRARWREVVKECHPDLAGNASSERFRAIKESYHVLGDPERRVQYERVWRETIEHIERARAFADTVEIEQMPELGERATRAIKTIAARMGGFLGVAEEVGEEPATTEQGERVHVDEPVETTTERELSENEPARLQEETMQDVLRRTEAMFEAVRGIDQRLAGAGFEGVGEVARLFEQLHTALDAVSVDEIDSTLADVERARQSLDNVARDLARLRRLKQSLGDGGSQGH